MKIETKHICLFGRKIPVSKDKWWENAFYNSLCTSDVLHPNTIYVKEFQHPSAGKFTKYILERPPSYQELTFQPNYFNSEIRYNYKCYLPYIQIVGIYQKIDNELYYYDSSIFWSPQSLTSTIDYVYPCGLGNIYTRGTVCWKYVQRPRSNNYSPTYYLNKMLNLYLSTPFTTGTDTELYQQQRNLKVWPEECLNSPTFDKIPWLKPKSVKTLLGDFF